MTEMEMYGKELSRRHGMEIALARTPAETTCQRFAVSDMLHDEYRNAVLQVVKGDKEAALANIKRTHDLPVYYTNGTHVPPGARISLVDRINIEHVFFPIVDGGNICHIWMGEGAPDAKGLKEFAMNLAKNTQIGYFAFTKDMTVCLNDFHIMSGLKECCENCGSGDVEQVSRVTGYVQAVNGWNAAKKQELADRMRYSSSDMI
jgi:ribonucleoside-triphosphate reductase